MTYRVKFQHVICWLALFSLIKQGLSQCLASNGMQFKKHEYRMLDVTPLEIIDIVYYLECLHQCQSRSVCRSVNIKRDEDRLTCELLAVKAGGRVLIHNVNSTHYEDETIVTGISQVKNYCEPECNFFGACTNSIPKCRCEKGSIQALDDHKPVKVGAKGRAFGTVTVNIPTGLYKIKLVYSSGYLCCVADSKNYRTNFGCKTSTREAIEIWITKVDNVTLLPGAKGYKHDGKNARSTFVTFNDAINLVKGQKLRIWYLEDLNNSYETDNKGHVFMYVLAVKQD